MSDEYILTSTEFSKLIDITTESLRSRRRRGMYKDQYVLKNKSYLWKRPRQKHIQMTAFNRRSVGRGPRYLKHAPRNKNSGNHKLGITKNYPNKNFELSNEFKMIAKAQRKISAAAAEEITPEVIELAKQRHQEKLLKNCEPIKIKKYSRGIYDARNEPIPNKRIGYQDEAEDEENAFRNRYY